MVTIWADRCITTQTRPVYEAGYAEADENARAENVAKVCFRDELVMV
jgi:hypothetical protein